MTQHSDPATDTPSQSLEFPVRLVWTLIVLMGALAMGWANSQDAKAFELIVHRGLICGLWFVPAALALRFFVFRKRLPLALAILVMSGCWLGFAGQHRAFQPEMTVLDMAGDLPAILFCAIPYAGPVLGGMALSENVRLETRTRDSFGRSAAERGTKRVLPELIGFMAALSVAITRWRHHPPPQPSRKAAVPLPADAETAAD